MCALEMLLGQTEQPGWAGQQEVPPALGTPCCVQCHGGMLQEQGSQPGSREWPRAGAAQK